jgi:hypothetical protein
MMIWLNGRYDGYDRMMIDGYDMIDRYYDYHKYTIRQMDTQFVILRSYNNNHSMNRHLNKKSSSMMMMIDRLEYAGRQIGR